MVQLRQNGNFKYITILFFVSLFLVLPQIYEQGIVLNFDSLFHLNRFYEAMMNLKTGNFSTISLYGFTSVGRIVSSVYGQGFSFICGMLLLVLRNWISFQVVLSFLILFISGLGMYCLGKESKLSNKFSLISSLLYFGCFETNSFTFGTSMTGLSSMILPWIIICGLRLGTREKGQVNILMLAFWMGVALNSHNFTALLSAVVLTPFLIIGFIRSTERKKLLFDLGIAILITIFLSLNIFYNIFSIMRENHLITVMPKMELGFRGAFFSINNSASGMDIGLQNSLLFIAQICYVCFSWKNLNNQIGKLNKIMTILGVVFLIFSSRLIPWTILGKLFPVLQSTIQMPSRFIVVANVCFALGVALSLSALNRSNILSLHGEVVTNIILIIFLVLSFSRQEQFLYGGMQNWVDNAYSNFSSNYYFGEDKEQFKFLSRKKGVSYLVTEAQTTLPDYLPLKRKLTNQELIKLNPSEKYKNEVLSIPKGIFEKRITEDKKIAVTWTEKETPKERIVPIIVYKQTKLELNGQRLTKNDFDTTEIGALKLKGTQGENTLLVTYQEGKFSSIIYKITIFSWIALLLAFAVKFTLKCKKRELSSEKNSQLREM
ncbi:hypothetical protein SAMN02745116_01992 [Pilibacter termitis]|uniref:Membrane protein YfhO n=1 Tax=Pilibacter termitis TaxID=263852 RepID=A0A1T4PZJ7_9ENTE|nr:hypothetical protein [Pilibacter termitis]SJZ96727.1 hypothetical protein SAMN02745116_01992 [Pilibacter termitis]